jgi:hypothetical protein
VPLAPVGGPNPLLYVQWLAYRWYLPFVFYGPVPYALAAHLNASFLTAFWSLKVVALLASVLAGVEIEVR